MQCVNLDISFKLTTATLCICCQQGHKMYYGYTPSNCSKPQTAHLKVTCSWLDSMCFPFDNLLNVVLEWFLRPVEASADSVPHCILKHKKNCYPCGTNVEHENGPESPQQDVPVHAYYCHGYHSNLCTICSTPMHMAKHIQCPSLYRHPAATTDDAIAKPNTLRTYCQGNCAFVQDCMHDTGEAHGTDPSSIACLTRFPHRSSVFNALALPMTMSEDRARVRPTLTRRSSATNPMLPCFLPSRTVLKIATSFSLPCRCSSLVPEYTFSGQAE